MTTTNPSSPPCHLWKQLPETILITHILPFLPKDNRNPLLETNHDFLSLKRQHQTLQLNEKHSLEYLLDLKGYRERVHRAVKDTRRQLQIRLYYPEDKFPSLVPSSGFAWEIRPLKSLASLCLSSHLQICFHIEDAGDVDLQCLACLSFAGFRINTCRLRVVSSLNQVIEHLKIVDCKHLSIRSKGVKAISLDNIDQCTVWDCEISDVSELSQIPKLRFFNCAKLNDLSPLGEHQISVSFHSCPLISDVTMFSEARSFSIDDCPLITALPAFNQAKSISLTGYKGRDIQSLRMAERVDFRNSHLLSDLSLLSRNLLSLDITGCVQIESIPLFPFLQSLRISQCYRIKSLPALTNLVHLDIDCSAEFPSQLSSGLDGLEGLKNFAVGHVTYLSYLEDFLSTHFLKHVYYKGSGLSFHDTYSINVLFIVSNNDLVSLKLTTRLRELYIHACTSLGSIDIHNSVDVIEITSCLQLTNIAISANVKNCGLQNCPKLAEFNFPTDINTMLRVSGCPELQGNI